MQIASAMLFTIVHSRHNSLCGFHGNQSLFLSFWWLGSSDLAKNCRLLGSRRNNSLLSKNSETCSCTWVWLCQMKHMHACACPCVNKERDKDWWWAVMINIFEVLVYLALCPSHEPLAPHTVKYTQRAALMRIDPSLTQTVLNDAEYWFDTALPCCLN